MSMGNLYVPPFEITNKMLKLVSEISTLMARGEFFGLLNKHPRLRRNNRIRSVHSSLAIEANSLSVDEVRDVLDNRLVMGPQQEIQEAKNAFAAYDLLPHLSPWKVKDLLRAHGVMTNLLVQESGKYRHGGEGVFDKDKCIFMAPPAERVPFLVQDLLDWVKREGKNVHPLIMSCVVHYELVFIHPFSDGNGRMARLWQTLILSRWQEMFAYLPVESQIEKFQSAYYKTIDKCNRNGNSSLFIEFMLERIKSVLEEVLQLGEKDEFDNVAVQKLLSVMDNHKNYSALELMGLLKIQTRVTLQKTYLKPAIEIGVVEMTMPDKPTSKNQKYRKI